MKVAELLPGLSGVRKGGQGFVAKCPAHDDRDPSLSLCEDNGRILMKCFAGCKTETIVRKLGLNWKDLFDKTMKGPTAASLGESRTPAMHRSIGGARYYGGSGGRVHCVYPYVDEKGRLLYECPVLSKGFQAEAL